MEDMQSTNPDVIAEDSGQVAEPQLEPAPAALTEPVMVLQYDPNSETGFRELGRIGISGGSLSTPANVTDQPKPKREALGITIMQDTFIKNVCQPGTDAEHVIFDYADGPRYFRITGDGMLPGWVTVEEILE